MPTIVFDIDNTICWNKIVEAADLDIKDACVNVLFIGSDVFMYKFVPYFNLLLEYLLRMGCRIEFFSAGDAIRNVPLIDRYLSDKQVLGQERYQALKEAGQFKIFSRHELINDKKRLIRDAEPAADRQLCDVILVDDSIHYSDADNGEEAMIQVPAGLWRKNHTFYLLGYFMEYFEQSNSIRRFVEQQVRFDGAQAWIPKGIDKMTSRGLTAVMQTRPEAVYYPVICELKNTYWNGVSAATVCIHLIEWMHDNDSYSKEWSVVLRKDLCLSQVLYLLEALHDLEYKTDDGTTKEDDDDDEMDHKEYNLALLMNTFLYLLEHVRD